MLQLELDTNNLSIQGLSDDNFLFQYRVITQPVVVGVVDSEIDIATGLV